MSYASQQFLQVDNSSIANFKAWGSAISAAIAAMGWIQQNDTGQVVWTASVATLTQATRTGGNTVYTYSGSLTGPALRIGMSVIITGFTNGGNNVTATITALNGTTDFTVVNGTGVNETHPGSATTTAIAAVPGSSTYTYEIWAPADALQTGGTAFYMKFEYGTSTTVPGLQITIATATNGAGTLSGTPMGPYNTSGGSSVNHGANTYECYFSGDTNRLNMLLWRNNPTTTCVLWIGIERTKNTDGTDSSDGVSLWLSQINGWNLYQALIFGVGVTSSLMTVFPAGIDMSNASTEVFNNSIPVNPVFHLYGKYGNPALAFGLVHLNDVVNASTFSTTMYGATHTYLVSGDGISGTVPFAGSYRLGMRFE